MYSVPACGWQLLIRCQISVTMKKESLLGVFQKVYVDYVSDWRRLLLSFPVGTSFLVSSTLAVGVRDDGLNGSPDIFVEDCSSIVGGRCSVVRSFDDLSIEDQLSIVSAFDSSTPVYRANI